VAETEEEERTKAGQRAAQQHDDKALWAIGRRRDQAAEDATTRSEGLSSAEASRICKLRADTVCVCVRVCLCALRSADGRALQYCR
jgi:hypothetical protein